MQKVDWKPQSTYEEAVENMGGQAAIDSMKVLGNRILVAIWRRGEVTKGGIILTDKTRDEDHFQGRIGFVIRKGTLAFKNDKAIDFGDDNVAVGDRVFYRVSNGSPMDVNGVWCRLIEDVHIEGVLSDSSVTIW